MPWWGWALVGGLSVALISVSSWTLWFLIKLADSFRF